MSAQVPIKFASQGPEKYNRTSGYLNKPANTEEKSPALLKEIKNRFRQGISFIRRDEPALMTFLFHSIFRSEKEIELNHIDPQQFITLDIYRQFLDYFLEAGYQFISSRELLAGLDPEGRYLLATFDDGYYNNQHVLPLLQEYRVPALFFIATHNVLNNECFWWDVVYRELSRKGLNRKEISVAQKKYKKKTHEEIISRGFKSEVHHHRCRRRG